MIRRLLWRCAYPFVVLAYQTGASYRWVNVSLGAWRRDTFDALWHWRWYGDPITSMPDELTLCGIGYRVAASEGSVIFTEAHPIWGQQLRLVFEREAALWYVEAPRASVDHVLAAYRWIEAVYGGAHLTRKDF